MSYYDLSYRYKYEAERAGGSLVVFLLVFGDFCQLRAPVMDLFDLALQTEGHRQACSICLSRASVLNKASRRSQ